MAIDGRFVVAWVERTSGEHWRVRYRRGDGSVTSDGGYTTLRSAENRAREIEVDQRRHSYHDPALAQMTLAEWLPNWWLTLDVDELTLENYKYLVTKHIWPRFAHQALGRIHSSEISQWSTELHAHGYEHTTVQGILGLLGRILGDAVDDGLIAANPVHHHRNRGKRARRIHREMLWATPEEVLRGALQAAHLHDRSSALLIVTAAWTGCRWGELAALQRHNIHLDDRTIVIDPDLGSLKESAHRQWLGPPKTAASARTITLPTFLAVLLKHHLESHDHFPVFVNAEGGFLWRRSWRSRTFNPAFDGNLDQPNPAARTYPIRPGLTFHELRQATRPGSSLPASPKSLKPDAWATVSTNASSRSTATSPTKSRPASKPLSNEPGSTPATPSPTTQYRHRSPDATGASDGTYPTTAPRTPQGSSRAPRSDCPNPGC